jgi:hypothetical protein
VDAYNSIAGGIAKIGTPGGMDNDLNTPFSQPFVGSVRASYNGYKMEPEAPRLVERNGKVYEQNTANIGKRPQREQTEAPAPYREGGATKQAEEPPRSEPEPQPKPAARPVRPPESTTNAQAREAHVSAFALCGFMDRASMAINEQQHHIAGFLLDENDAGKLRVSIGNLRLALDELEERVS